MGRRMGHAEAVETQAVERYLLGEMDPWEAEAFEQHFFQCGECVEALESGAQFTENARALGTAVAAAPTPRARLGWFKAWWARPAFAAPALVAAVLAGVVGYQGLELARLNQPRALEAYVLRAERRGPERNSIRSGIAPVAVEMDLPEPAFPYYRCDLYNGSGKLRFSISSAAPAAGAPLRILMPARLAVGSYTLRVEGLSSPAAPSGPEVAHYDFAVTP
jgi:hypothetical protein